MLSISKGTRFNRASLQLWYGNLNINLAASGYSAGEKAWLYPSSWNIFGLHLLTGRSFLRVLPSADRKNWEECYWKHSLKETKTSEALEGEWYEMLNAGFQQLTLLVPVRCLQLFLELSVWSLIWLIISCSRPCKADCTRQDFYLCKH